MTRRHLFRTPPSNNGMQYNGKRAAVRWLTQICCFNGFDKSNFEMSCFQANVSTSCAMRENAGWELITITPNNVAYLKHEVLRSPEREEVDQQLNNLARLKQNSATLLTG